MNPLSFTNLAGNYSSHVVSRRYSGTPERTARRRAKSSNDYGVFGQSFNGSRRRQARRPKPSSIATRDRENGIGHGTAEDRVRRTSPHSRRAPVDPKRHVQLDVCERYTSPARTFRSSLSANSRVRACVQGRCSAIGWRHGGCVVGIGQAVRFGWRAPQGGAGLRCRRQPRRICRDETSPRRGRAWRGHMDSCRRCSILAWFSSDCRVRPGRGMFTRGRLSSSVRAQPSRLENGASARL